MPDDDRYVQYLQEQLLSDDHWRPVLDRLRVQPPPSIPAQVRDVGLREMLQRWSSFEPSTRYDLPATHAIFQPILDDVAVAAATIGVLPVANTRLATSTEMAAGPISRPGTGGHLLFVGPGTSAFCNYWAKVIAWHLDSLAQAIGHRPIAGRAETRVALRLDARPLEFALKLALRYARDASVVGFGTIDLPETANGVRNELLTGMETFALAHEYSHFVAEERLPELSGRDLEVFCDRLGLQLARNAPSQQANWSNFVGAGAIAFFAASKFCLEVEAIGFGRPAISRDSHPLLPDRIASVVKSVAQTTSPDQLANVNAYVDDFVAVLDNFFEEGLEIARALIGQPHE